MLEPAYVRRCTSAPGLCPEGDLNPHCGYAADLVKVYLSGFAGVKLVLRCGWLWLWRSCGAPAGSTDDLVPARVGLCHGSLGGRPVKDRRRMWVAWAATRRPHSAAAHRQSGPTIPCRGGDREVAGPARRRWRVEVVQRDGVCSYCLLHTGSVIDGLELTAGETSSAAPASLLVEIRACRFRSAGLADAQLDRLGDAGPAARRAAGPAGGARAGPRPRPGGSGAARGSAGERRGGSRPGERSRP
jgi:hypothetical protein